MIKGQSTDHYDFLLTFHSTGCNLYDFRDIASYLSKVTNFSYVEQEKFAKSCKFFLFHIYLAPLFG